MLHTRGRKIKPCRRTMLDTILMEGDFVEDGKFNEIIILKWVF